MDEIETLRQNYFENVIKFKEEKEFIEALPKPDYPDFFSMINGIIMKLKDELAKIKTLLSSSPDETPDFIEYYNDEIKSINHQINICQNLLAQAKKDEAIIEEFAKQPIKNIVFATTTGGNISLEKDLKVIPEEYYQDIIDMLKRIEQGVTENNEVQAHSFNSSHRKLCGCHEVKTFKVRIVYKILSSDTVYVFLAKLKKSDNDSRDRTEIVTRASNQSYEYELLKEQLKNPHIKQKIIDENRKILINLYEYLNQKKRGRNGK